MAAQEEAPEIGVLAQQEDVAVTIGLVDLGEARAALVEEDTVVVCCGKPAADDVSP
jgi:hypothetical protein